MPRVLDGCSWAAPGMGREQIGLSAFDQACVRCIALGTHRGRGMRRHPEAEEAATTHLMTSPVMLGFCVEQASAAASGRAAAACSATRVRVATAAAAALWAQRAARALPTLPRLQNMRVGLLVFSC